jgi:hypothetical protein
MKYGVVLSGCCWLAALTTPALAVEPNAGQRATAEAMFRQAAQLMDEHRYAEACDKFSASQELDPGLGTQLYLADCYDHAGRTASAWALFREVEDLAGRAGQVDRQRIAQERASALESQLSRVELKVAPARRAPGLKVTANGVDVPPASWNAPLPIDPGKVKIEVSAPGRRPWSTTITVAKGATQQALEVPELKALPKSATTPAASKAGADRGDSAQSTVGYVTGGIGIVALGVGGFLAYRSYQRNQESKEQCRADQPNLCTPDGVAQREQARDTARLATIVSLSGAGLVIGGATLVLTASPGVVKNEHASAQLSLRGVW